MDLVYTLEFDMLSSRINCNFDHRLDNVEDKDLIISAVFFTARFFRIAEKITANETRNYLLNIFSSANTNDIINEPFVRKIFRLTMNTLPANKQKAILELDQRLKFYKIMGSEYNGPKLEFKNEQNDPGVKNQISKYIYSVKSVNDQYYDNLKMPFFSPQRVLIPLSLAFILSFIINNFKDHHSIRILGDSMRSLLFKIEPGDSMYSNKANSIIKDIVINNGILR